VNLHNYADFLIKFLVFRGSFKTEQPFTHILLLE